MFVAVTGLTLPSRGGGSASLRPHGDVLEAPRLAELPIPRDDGAGLRGPTRDLVAQWTPVETRRQRKQKPVPLAPEREIILTFDDGPDMHTTPLVLRELQRRNLKAIFFVAGRRLVAGGQRGRIQRALVRQMVREGHLVANHTIHHVHLCRRPQRIAEELDGNDQIIKDVTGTQPIMFRAPFGDRCPELDQAMAARGLVNVGWSIDPQDWRRLDPTEVADYVKRKLDRLPGRAVLLMHDTRKAGALALPHILDYIEAVNRRAQRGETRPIHIRDHRALLPPTNRPDPGMAPNVDTGMGVDIVARHVLENLNTLTDLPGWPTGPSERLGKAR